MALRRRSERNSSLIWPGFVDAMTALLLVMMFVLSIFMIVQYVLREELIGKDRSLQTLTAQLGALTSQLSIAEEEAEFFESELQTLSGLLEDERARAADLTAALDAEAAETERLSDQLAQRVLEIAALSTSLEQSRSETDQLQSLVAVLTDERDAARVALSDLQTQTSDAAAIRDQNAALQEQIAELTSTRDETATALSQARSDAEAAQSAVAERDAMLAEIRARLAAAEEEERQTELTLGEKIAALELALDQKREEAEETLLLLAAIEAKRDELQDLLSNAQLAATQARQDAEQLRRTAAQGALDAEKAAAQLLASRAALDQAQEEISTLRLNADDGVTALAEARSEIASLRAEGEAAQRETSVELSRREQVAAFARASLQSEREISAEGRRAVALLNTQVRQLRNEIASLRLLLDESEQRAVEQDVVIQDLGARLNQALAEKVTELQRYRSEFFGRMREILGDRDDIRVVGDRFVFQSEVLFDTGQAELGSGGREQLSRLASAIREIEDGIPTDLNWILRVDGHTDSRPISGLGRYRSNWELSQARALSVVSYLVDQEGVNPERLAAAGFGEFHPLDTDETNEAFARNRRIEMRFTER